MKKVYGMTLEINEKEIEEIFDQIDRGKEEIWKGYSRLSEMGVIKLIREEIPDQEHQSK